MCASLQPRLPSGAGWNGLRDRGIPRTAPSAAAFGMRVRVWTWGPSPLRSPSYPAPKRLLELAPSCRPPKLHRQKFVSLPRLRPAGSACPGQRAGPAAHAYGYHPWSWCRLAPPHGVRKLPDLKQIALHAGLPCTVAAVLQGDGAVERRKAAGDIAHTRAAQTGISGRMRTTTWFSPQWPRHAAPGLATAGNAHHRWIAVCHAPPLISPACLRKELPRS